LLLFFLDGIEDDFEASHSLFRDAFKNGFPWEVLKVLSGPPGPILFTWRHWAHFNGNFQGREGNGELIELYGLCRVIVNEDLKIQKLEVGNFCCNLFINLKLYFVGHYINCDTNYGINTIS
jgi:hypothetical protein